MDYLYSFIDGNGQTRYLLANNMPYADRCSFQNMLQSINRVGKLAGGAACVLSVEFALRNQRCKQMAWGWWCLSVVACSFVMYTGFIEYFKRSQAPMLGAYLRKYSDCAKTDPFEIKDRTREFYQIDDS